MGVLWPWRQDTVRALAATARAHLLAGRLLALPTETFYALAAYPFNEEALRRLFAVKGRPPEKPVLLLVSPPDMVVQVAAAVPALARQLMARWWPGPLTLILPARQGLPRGLTGEGMGVGVRQPRQEATCRLIEALGFPVTGTSANRSGQPGLTQAADVARELAGKLALILEAGPCPGGAPSTIVDFSVHPPRLVRPGAVPVSDLRALIPELETDAVVYGEKTGGSGP